MKYPNGPPNRYKNTLGLLRALDVPVDTWTGNFTSNMKMMRYLERVQPLNDPNRVIYHTDLDEFVDKGQMKLALKELEMGHCDAVKLGCHHDNCWLSAYSDRWNQCTHTNMRCYNHAFI
jgi:hypothetical protein